MLRDSLAYRALCSAVTAGAGTSRQVLPLTASIEVLPALRWIEIGNLEKLELIAKCSTTPCCVTILASILSKLPE
jgi:hypothetical protein